MARDEESRKEAQYIAKEFLDAAPDTKLGKYIASLGSIAQCRRRLIQYIKKWRLKLHTRSFQDSDGNEISWDEDADEEDLHMLYAIEPFLIWCQNDYGPDHYLYEEEDKMDITRIPRSAFLDYFYGPFDIDHPTKEDREQRLSQWARRHPTSPQNGGGPSSAGSQNGQGTTSSTSSKKKSNSIKKGIQNFVSLSDDSKFKEWMDDVDAIAAAEGTSAVLDPDFTPTPDQEDEFDANCKHIYAMLRRHGNTGIIKDVLSKTTNGQEAIKMIRLEYSDQHAGRARAEELRTKLNSVRVPEEHRGQVAECVRKFNGLIDEHNSMVGENLKIDNRSKLEKLKDMMSNIAEFDTVEDTLTLTDTADSMPVENILKLYMKKAIAIDKRYKKSQSRTSSARRSNTGLNVNVAESLFDDVDDIEAVEAFPPEDDIPVEAMLNAFASRTYGGGGGQGGYRVRRERQPFDGSTFIPRETFNTITRDGKAKWTSIPKEDRAKIVALFKHSPEPDSSSHPSPGQGSHISPSRSTNNHSIRFDETNDHNPFGVLGENDEDVVDDGGVTSLNMNSLRINKTLTIGSEENDPQEPEDSPNVARALTIMNAVSSPVSSETLDRSVSNLHPGDIMRTLSTSLCVPSSSIPSSPLSNTNQDVKWKYGESDKTSKPRKWFNRRGKDGQEVKLSANMMSISGSGNDEKRDINAGSEDMGVGNTADRWGAAAQAEILRLTMYGTFDGSQDKYKAMCDTGANASFCNDIPLLSDRTSTVFDPQEETSGTEQGSPQEETSGTEQRIPVLVDRGSNITALSGDSVRILHLSDETLNVDVLGDHEMENLKIGSVGGVVATQLGDILVIFNEIAYREAGLSVLSSIQVEDNGIHIDDKSTNHGGNQCITTYEGYVIPLDCVQGLMYMDIRPFTDDEARTLPRVLFTRDIPWDPTKYDSTSLRNRMDARDAYTSTDKVDNKQYIKYGLDMEKEDPEFMDNLKDEICKRGAMDALVSERAQGNMGYAHTGVNVSEEEESDYEYTYTYTYKEDEATNGINDRRTDGW
jgi:hypothetical protein